MIGILLTNKQLIMSELSSKINIGDKVRVVGAGGIVFTDTPMVSTSFVYLGYENGFHWYDILPKIIGKEGVVTNVIESQGRLMYSLSGIPEKVSWYSEFQLELV